MLLLFRMGDFYEMFDSDARSAARILGLTLTSRDKTTDMAGFPHHQLEAYLHKLLKEGVRVAICDQVDSANGKTVKREVTRVVTPGSMTDESIQHVTDDALYQREFELRKILDRDKTPDQLEEMRWVKTEIRRRARAS